MSVLCQCQNHSFKSHCKTDYIKVGVGELNIPCIVPVTRKLAFLLQFLGRFVHQYWLSLVKNVHVAKTLLGVNLTPFRETSSF